MEVLLGPKLKPCKVYTNGDKVTKLVKTINQIANHIACL